MNYFYKLNVVSMLYGLMFFISLEIQINYYRIVRLTGWEGQYFDNIVLLVHGVGFVVATIVLYKLTFNFFQLQKSPTSIVGEMNVVLSYFSAGVQKSAEIS
ncbi:hypothetical protein [Lysinibacillus xylanilyticus]|uniref:hypothetical protein n=1 Tax=Lysinibacillus xylanilyticus TaxID=582475 RepID=UPI003CFE9835